MFEGNQFILFSRGDNVYKFNQKMRHKIMSFIKKVKMQLQNAVY
ncbi:hypothetical protein LLB_1120 [Legionella longbeachae D-4968]|nr:hypothetical protein LLB_1120 [Legionella longbeachae D-4968]